jgi:hypothetical protein
MARKPKATSLDGMLKAMSNVLADPLPPPYPLDAKHKAIWNDILTRRARDEWHPVDLRFAWQLTNLLIRLKEQETLLEKEELLVNTEKGCVPNPRLAIVERLTRQTVTLSRYLRIHPASDGRDPTMVRGGREAEQKARAALPAPSPADPRREILPMQ